MRNPFAPPESVARHLKIAVTGKPGTGKTVFGLAACLAGLGKVAIISNEAGDVHYIKHPTWGGFDRLPTQRIEQLEEAVAFIAENPGTYGTLVIDTVTGIYEALVSAAAKADGSVSVKSWGLIKRRWRSLMAKINNLPLNIIAVVHENDITETDDKTGKVSIVGQKLDAEKTFERNPDILVRLATKDGKRVCRVLKDRTGTYQAGEVVENPSPGLWLKAIKEGKAEARIETPEEADPENEKSLAKPAPEAPTERAVRRAENDADAARVETPAAIEARLLAMCAVGWRDWDEKRAWSKANKAIKDMLPADAQERISAAFVAASPSKTPTTKPAANAAA